MRFYIKNIIFTIIIFSYLWGNPITVINVWHQMLYENREVLRDVCDRYEKNNKNNVGSWSKNGPLTT